jgi:NodT family efflux transporter outer membrane factor (OMF) lipoprotein
MRSHLFIGALGTVLTLGACAPKASLSPRPVLRSETWSGAAAAPAATGSSSLAFGSPELERILVAARARNADIAVAAARVVQARGKLGEARSVPAVSVGGGIGSGLHNSGSSLGLDVAWELDLFGRVSAAKKAARARFVAATWDRDAVALAVEAETARAFISHAALTDRLEIIDRSLAAARDLERIISIRVREGAATRVESGRQTIEVRRLESRRSEIAEARVHAGNALAVLAGEEAPLFRLEEVRLASLSLARPGVPPPASLLLRRPDILASEARIRAAEGDVDRARAAFMPNLALSAGSLLRSAAGGPLQLAVSSGSSLLAPIFDRGRLKGRLTTAAGADAEAVELYRRTLLVALRECEDALTSARAAEQRSSLLSGSTAEARRTVALVRRQYVEGAADLQGVLDAERALLGLEDEQVSALQSQFEAAVQLWKATGGARAGTP